ncbi:MAG: Uracil phosphoribosyltransferase, partial [uncultured Corynebacteriales bacterium]
DREPHHHRVRRHVALDRAVPRRHRASAAADQPAARAAHGDPGPGRPPGGLPALLQPDPPAAAGIRAGPAPVRGAHRADPGRCRLPGPADVTRGARRGDSPGRGEHGVRAAGGAAGGADGQDPPPAGQGDQAPALLLRRVAAGHRRRARAAPGSHARHRRHGAGRHPGVAGPWRAGGPDRLRRPDRRAGGHHRRVRPPSPGPHRHVGHRPAAQRERVHGAGDRGLRGPVVRHRPV